MTDLNKSGYKGYTEADNAKRKTNNIGDTEVKAMPRVKAWGGSGANAAAKEAKESKVKSSKNEVTYTHTHPETGEKVTVSMTPRKLKSYQKKMAKIKPIKKTSKQKMEELVKIAMQSGPKMSGTEKPSIKMPSIPKTNMPKLDMPKIPGLAPAGKKDPIKQVEQIQNKDIKDTKMKEAQAGLSVNKTDEEVKMPKKEYEKEHNRLINVLESKSKKDDKKEAKKQKKEMKENGVKIKKTASEKMKDFIEYLEKAWKK